MASRRKQKGKRPQSGQLYHQALREFEKRDYKQALKDAKVCHRQDPAEPHRRLLEQALCARALELVKLGLTPQARDVADDLLELGITDSGVQEQSAALFFSLGMQSAKTPALSAEAEAELLQKLADRAVAKPQSGASLPAEVRQGANTIRQALEAIEQNREADALSLLKGISRNSPFADWKLFARGLAAYYREDNLEMGANWERLDSQRPAATIAETLRAMAESDRSLVPEDVRIRVGRLERKCMQTSAFSNLGDLQRLMLDEDDEGVLRHIKTNAVGMRKLDADLKARIVPILIQWGIQYLTESGFREMTRYLEALPLDPHWHRTWALFWEDPENDDPQLAEESWRNYLEDLPRIQSFSPAEQSLADSLVCLRVAGLLMEEIGWYENSPVEVPEMLEGLAEEYFTRCIQQTPTLKEAYREFSLAQKSWGQPDRAIQTLEQFLEHVPDAFEEIIEVGVHHLNRGDPFRGRDLVYKAMRLKPLDQNAKNLAFAANLRVARELAQFNKWEEARNMLAEAESLDETGKQRMELLCRKAALEIKAGQIELGRELAEEAQNAVEDPTPALLILVMEASRYQLPDEWREEWSRAWDAALKRKVNTATAGRMCEQMFANIVGGVEYPSREHQVQGLLKYVERSTRYKYQAEELMFVCEFLHEMGETKFLAKMIRKGRKNLADFPFFHLLAGKLELDKGPVQCNRGKASKAFEQALKTAERSDHPDAKKWAEIARDSITLLREYKMPAFPFFGGRPSGGPESIPPQMEKMIAKILEQMNPEQLEELLNEDDEYDDQTPFFVPPKPKRRG